MDFALEAGVAADLVEHSLTGTVLYQDTVLYANPAFEKITGYDQETLRRMHVWGVFHPSFQETVKNKVAQRMAGVQTSGFHHDLKIITPENKLKWVRSFAKTIPYGTSYAGMLNMYEITDQKMLEFELADVYRNMARQVSEAVSTQRAQENLLIQQSKMAAMGEMVAAIAHQWRQPLNLISLVVQDFKEMFESPKTKQEDIDDTIYLCMEQIHYMSQTINDFQNYLKPSAAGECFDLNETLRGTLKLLGDQHLRRNVETVLDLDSTVTEVKGLENELKQVLLILLNNALDAISETKQSGTVRIATTRLDDARVSISVEDDGGGIPDTVLPRIFEHYFTTKEANGTGLGLYMAKNIITEHMEGEITVENTPTGARFVITLPVA